MKRAFNNLCDGGADIAAKKPRSSYDDDIGLGEMKSEQEAFPFIASSYFSYYFFSNHHIQLHEEVNRTVTIDLENIGENIVTMVYLMSRVHTGL